MSGSPVPGRVSRRRLLQGGLAAGAAAGLGAAVLRAMAVDAKEGPTDAQLLQRLVVLEDSAVYLYGQLASKLAPAATPSPGGPLDPLTAVARFEGLHVDHRDVLAQALKGLGGTPVQVNGVYPQLLPTGSDQASTLAALSAMENTLLGAFHGAQGAFASAALAAQVASIYPVTARFQALLLAAGRQQPVPASFVTGDAAAAAAVVVTAGSSTSSSSTA